MFWAWQEDEVPVGRGTEEDWAAARPRKMVERAMEKRIVVMVVVGEV